MNNKYQNKMKYLFLFILMFSFSFNTIAQSFRYDTVPTPNKNQGRKLYRLEQPNSQARQSATQQKTSSQQTVKKESPSKSYFDKNKIQFGGSFGLAFGSGDYTSLNISPQVGYAFNKYFSSGFGISYSYYRYKYSHDNKQTFNYLGMNLYGRFNPIQYLTFQVQPEAYYAWGNNFDSQLVPCFLVGAGFTIPAGNGGINMMFYYDVVQYKSDGYHLSPYGDEIFYSVGYVFHF